MDIPIHSKVECSDGTCGETIGMIVNPLTDEVTHVVVREEEHPHDEFLVPLDCATRTEEGEIHLAISGEALKEMERFKTTKYIEERMPDFYPGAPMGSVMGGMYYYPYVARDRLVHHAIEEYHVPEGQIVLERGTKVEATDGEVGKVDELVVDRDTNEITHLVMREQHLFGSKQIVVPLWTIAEANGDVVKLKLNKEEIDKLPDYPLERRWK